jgi:hypothetical protein
VSNEAPRVCGEAAAEVGDHFHPLGASGTPSAWTPLKEPAARERFPA